MMSINKREGEVNYEVCVERGGREIGNSVVTPEIWTHSKEKVIMSPKKGDQK